jgi:tetratricopeptide (TPR) repeat protein
MTAALLAAVATAAFAPPASAQGPSAEDALAEARDAARAGRWDEALDALGAFGRDAPTEVRREHARVLLTLGRFDDALEVAGPAGGDPELDNVRGEALRGLGRLDEARAAFLAAERGGATDALPARLNRARLLLVRGEREQAHELFDSFFDAYNDGAARSAEDLMAVGTAVRQLSFTDSRLVQDALRAYEEAAAADPTDLRPEILVGELFLSIYVAPEAHAAFDRVLEVNPTHPRALLGKARVLEFDGDGAAAMERAGMAEEVAPDRPDVRAFLGRLHLASEAYDRARAEAEAALRSSPAHPDALSVLAAVHFFREDPAEYARVRDRALALYPGFSDFFVTLAEIAERQRRYHDAVKLAEQAVERDGDDARALGVLAMNELRTQKVADGRRHMERAFELDPYSPWYKNTLDLLDSFERYETVSTEHFEILMDRDQAPLLGPYAAALAEEAYAALAARYGAEPPTPVRVELLRTHNDFSVRTFGEEGLGALGVSFGSTLVMDSPTARDPGEFNWASTLWHELSHAFHLAMTEHRVPRWFSEGLSVLEQRRARERWGMGPTPGWLRAYDGGLMPPVSRLNEAFVRPRYPGQVIHGYYQASLVFTMIEERWGFEAIREMLDGYRAGRSTDELVRRVLSLEPEALDEAFDEWIRERFGDRMAAVTALDATGGGGEETGEPHADLESLGPGMGSDLGALRRAARRAPGSYPVRLALGRALFEAGEPGEAEGELRAALRLFPEYGAPRGPLWWLARIHEERGELEQAAGALHALGRRGESLWRVHAEEARLRLALGDTAAAAAALEKAVEVVPFESELHLGLADAYASLGDADGEVRERKAVVALDPADRAEALYLLARALHRADRPEEARKQVLGALEIAPSYDAALELLLELRGGGS